MEEKVIDKILEVQALCLKINSREKNTCFLSYYGHSDMLSLSVYERGWFMGIRNSKKFITYLYKGKEAIIDMDKMIKYLKEIKDGIALQG